MSVQARLEQARYAMSRGISQRRACTLMNVSRSGLYYTLKMPMKNAPVIEAMQRLSGQYPRFGSRRIRIFLGRQGIQIGKERCARLWCEAGLQVPAKRKRRRVASTQPRPCLPVGRNSVWSYDFVFDACANGQSLKCLTVVDEYTRQCLAIDVAGSIRAGRVIEVLSRLISLHGAPTYLRSDNGLVFTSRHYTALVRSYGLQQEFITPHCPQQNGMVERVIRTLKEQCTHRQRFESIQHAGRAISDWITFYNHQRPHQALKMKTPAQAFALGA